MPVVNHIVLDPRVAVTENPIQNNLLGPVSVIPFKTASQVAIVIISNFLIC